MTPFFAVCSPSVNDVPTLFTGYRFTVLSAGFDRLRLVSRGMCFTVRLLANDGTAFSSRQFPTLGTCTMAFVAVVLAVVVAPVEQQDRQTHAVSVIIHCSREEP
jgi:lipoprotein signal peptidase